MDRPAIAILVEAGDWPEESALRQLAELAVEAAVETLGAFPPPLRGRVREGGRPPLFPHSHVSVEERRNAKQLRGKLTRAEAVIWNEVRAHRLGGLGFRRQVPMGRYVADFVCHQAKLIVELDGEAHAETRARDRERDAWFASRGYRTLRFRNENVTMYPERVLKKIKEACGLHLSPLPDPPPQGGRGSAELEGREVPEISILFTDDAGIQRLNKTFRGKDKPTNVLSFPQGSGPLLGDIALAAETVRKEAALAKKAVEAHIAHLIVHGFFHLIGYDHAAAEEAEAMEALERDALRRMGIADPYAAAQEQ